MSQPLNLDGPVFCLTSDTDWASEACIDDFVAMVSGFGVRPTVFATHDSAVLRKHQLEGSVDVGAHPNFEFDSTHGADVPSVVEHVLGLYPDVKAFRSHCFVDSWSICREMSRRGLRYDSNLCLYLQPGLTPLAHASGLTRFPVFWGDDVHLERGGGWEPERLLETLLTPGLKVFNFHPVHTALNTPNAGFYASARSRLDGLGSAELASLR